MRRCASPTQADSCSWKNQGLSSGCLSQRHLFRFIAIHYLNVMNTNFVKIIQLNKTVLYGPCWQLLICAAFYAFSIFMSETLSTERNDHPFDDVGHTLLPHVGTIGTIGSALMSGVTFTPVLYGMHLGRSASIRTLTTFIDCYCILLALNAIMSIVTWAPHSTPNLHISATTLWVCSNSLHAVYTSIAHEITVLFAWLFSTLLYVASRNIYTADALMSLYTAFTTFICMKMWLKVSANQRKNESNNLKRK